MRTPRRIVVVGVGKLGSALLEGWKRSHAYAPEDLAAVTRTEESAQRVAHTFGVATSHQAEALVAEASLVMLCVKPTAVVPTLASFVHVLAPGAVVVSTAAGIPLAALSAQAPGVPVFRAMPNLPVRINAGITALARGAERLEEAEQEVEALFNSLGEAVWVDEKHLAAVTALSGSGPAYISLILEAFTDGGVKVGLPRATAYRLALATLRGSSELLGILEEHPAVLRDDVMTPAGVAIAGMHEMERAGIRSTLITTVEVATARANQLGEMAAAAIAHTPATRHK